MQRNAPGSKNEIGRFALTACPECDLLIKDTSEPHAHHDVLCPRCGAHLYRSRSDSLEATLALACAALVLLAVANAFPVIGLDINGERIDTTVIEAAQRLWQAGMHAVAVLVLVTTILTPMVEVVAIIWLVLPLWHNRRPAAFATVFRALRLAHPWAMVEVFILGILVALIKLTHVADVLPGPAVWCFGGLMLIMTTLTAILEPRDLWLAWESAQE